MTGLLSQLSPVDESALRRFHTHEWLADATFQSGLAEIVSRRGLDALSPVQRDYDMVKIKAHYYTRFFEKIDPNVYMLWRIGRDHAGYLSHESGAQPPQRRLTHDDAGNRPSTSSNSSSSGNSVAAAAKPAITAAPKPPGPSSTPAAPPPPSGGGAASSASAAAPPPPPPPPPPAPASPPPTASGGFLAELQKKRAQMGKA